MAVRELSTSALTGGWWKRNATRLVGSFGFRKTRYLESSKMWLKRIFYKNKNESKVEWNFVWHWSEKVIAVRLDSMHQVSLSHLFVIVISKHEDCKGVKEEDHQSSLLSLSRMSMHVLSLFLSKKKKSNGQRRKKITVDDVKSSWKRRRHTGRWRNSLT